MNKPLAVALLGAESTGKTQLALALAAHWQTQGLTAVAVAEVLRAWCDHAGRTPKPHEQVAIAQEQAHRTLAALATPGVHRVIADTTPLMTAVYSDKLFQDRSLYAVALAHHSIYTHTLLTGLDLPWVADGIQRDSPAVQAPVDTMVRSALGSAGIVFQVVYGQGEERLHNALRALNVEKIRCSTTESVAPTAYPISSNCTENRQEAQEVRSSTRATWAWACDKCSDPACEHRLFTGLQQVAAPAPPLR